MQYIGASHLPTIAFRSLQSSLFSPSPWNVFGHAPYMADLDDLHAVQTLMGWHA